MKKTKIFLLFVVCFAFFYGCQKTDEGSYVAPITLYEKITGTWGMTTPSGATAASVKEDDEIAKANSESLTEMDLSSQFNFASFTITFNVDANKKPTTFSVGGTAPQLISTSGYWDLDAGYPSTIGNSSKIYLYSDANKTTRTGTLTIQTIPGAAPQILAFKLTHSIQGVPYVSYLYSLYLQNSTK